MIRNPAIQNTGLVAFDGTIATYRDVSRHVNFGFSFEATAEISVDAVFKVQSAPASAADRCFPGAFTDVLAVADCKSPAVGALSTFTIPAGTLRGSVCSGTIPCANGSFIRLVPVSGQTTGVSAVLILQGPK
jgi:hypothetical protein